MPAEIDLTQLFAPRSVAILGASAVPSPGRYIIETLQNFGFEGGIYVVSPNSEIVADTPYYDALFNMPEAPDVVAFCVSSTRALDAFRTLPDIGARAAADSGSGWRRTGHIVRNRLTLPRNRRLRALRPKLMGVISPNARSAIYFQDGRMQPVSRAPCMPASTSWRRSTQTKTDVGVQFTEIRQKEGLRAALTWRRDQIKQYED